MVLKTQLEVDDNTAGSKPNLTALLGSVVYVATGAYNNDPQVEHLPGILTSIDNTLEKHCEISQICDTSNEHDHDLTCRVYVDKDLVRSAGSLVSDEELASRKLIIKFGGRGKHHKVKPLMMTDKGIALVDVSSISGIPLAVFAFPPAPQVHVVSGTLIFRDRECDFAARSEMLKLQKASRGILADSLEDETFRRRDFSEFRGHRLVLQGFWSQRNWNYQDVSGFWITCDRVEHNVEYQSIARIEQALNRL